MEMLKTHLNARTSGLVFQSKRKTALVNCVVLNKHLHPLLRKFGLERGGMHAFRHHRISTLVMAGTAVEVIKKWIGHGSEEMIRRYTHLRPDFMQDEQECPISLLKLVQKLLYLTLLTQNFKPWHDVSPEFSTAGRSSNWQDFRF
jgi:integrase-like protein